MHITPTAPKKTGEVIFETIKKIRSSGVFPLIMGGDHSIAYYTIKGCLHGYLNGLKKEEVAIIHLDAHLDLETSYLDYPNIYHGNSFRKLIEDDIIDGNNLFTIGVRGLIPSEIYQYAKEKQVNLYTSKLVKRVGIDKVLADFKQHIEKHRIKAVYVSLDIDCITPSEVRGTGIPLEGGLCSEDIYRFVRGLGNVNTIGFEIVELAPKIDMSEFSTLVAVNIFRNFLMFGLKMEES